MKRISILILCLCTLTPSLVYGDNAWVLWCERYNGFTKDDHDWSVEHGYPTHKACMDAQKDYMEKKSLAGGKTSLPEGWIILSPTTATYTRIRYTCLPDTIDPRK